MVQWPKEPRHQHPWYDLNFSRIFSSGTVEYNWSCWGFNCIHWLNKHAYSLTLWLMIVTKQKHIVSALCYWFLEIESKMVTILHTIFSNSYSCMKIVFPFQWTVLFPRFQFSINQFDQITGCSHHLNQGCTGLLTHIYVIWPRWVRYRLCAGVPKVFCWLNKYDYSLVVSQDAKFTLESCQEALRVSTSEIRCTPGTGEFVGASATRAFVPYLPEVWAPFTNMVWI